MVTKTTWQDMKKQWEIKENTKIDAVIIGAKASERFCKSFSTQSILKKVKEECALKDENDFGKMLMELKSLPKKSREVFINTINKIFGKYQDTKDVSEDTAKNYCNWIKNFESAYYLNFDYIFHLCNARNKKNGDPSRGWTTSDGFMGSHFSKNFKSSLTKLYYPNGNMILIKEDKEALKISYCKEGSKKVRDQATDQWRKGKQPVFICEGNYEDQWKAIEENTYLLYVYEQLQKLQGKVVLYGCEPNSTNNKQVIKYILNKEVEQLAISYQSDFEQNKNAFEQAIKDLARDDSYFDKDSDRDARIEKAEKLLESAFYFDQDGAFKLSGDSSKTAANDPSPDTDVA